MVAPPIPVLLERLCTALGRSAPNECKFIRYLDRRPRGDQVHKPIVRTALVIAASLCLASCGQPPQVGSSTATSKSTAPAPTVHDSSSHAAPAVATSSASSTPRNPKTRRGHEASSSSQQLADPLVSVDAGSFLKSTLETPTVGARLDPAPLNSLVVPEAVTKGELEKRLGPLSAEFKPMVALYTNTTYGSIAPDQSVTPYYTKVMVWAMIAKGVPVDPDANYGAILNSAGKTVRATVSPNGHCDGVWIVNALTGTYIWMGIRFVGDQLPGRSGLCAPGVGLNDSSKCAECDPRITQTPRAITAATSKPVMPRSTRPSGITCHHDPPVIAAVTIAPTSTARNASPPIPARMRPAPPRIHGVCAGGRSRAPRPGPPERRSGWLPGAPFRCRWGRSPIVLGEGDDAGQADHPQRQKDGSRADRGDESPAHQPDQERRRTHRQSDHSDVEGPCSGGVDVFRDSLHAVAPAAQRLTTEQHVQGDDRGGRRQATEHRQPAEHRGPMPNRACGSGLGMLRPWCGRQPQI